jgi:hypothetical protein
MGSVVVSASPVHMEKLEAEPVAKRKPSLRPTRWNSSSTVAYLKPVTPQCTVDTLNSDHTLMVRKLAECSLR